MGICWKGCKDILFMFYPKKDNWHSLWNKLAKCGLGADCDLQDIKYFSMCNCPSSDLWGKFYSREKNAYRTDKILFFCRYSHIKSSIHIHNAYNTDQKFFFLHANILKNLIHNKRLKKSKSFPWVWMVEILWLDNKEVQFLTKTR